MENAAGRRAPRCKGFNRSRVTRLSSRRWSHLLADHIEHSARGNNILIANSEKIYKMTSRLNVDEGKHLLLSGYWAVRSL